MQGRSVGIADHPIALLHRQPREAAQRRFDPAPELFQRGRGQFKADGGTLHIRRVDRKHGLRVLRGSDANLYGFHVRILLSVRRLWLAHTPKNAAAEQRAAFGWANFLQQAAVRAAVRSGVSGMAHISPSFTWSHSWQNTRYGVPSAAT